MTTNIKQHPQLENKQYAKRMIFWYNKTGWKQLIYTILILFSIHMTLSGVSPPHLHAHPPTSLYTTDISSTVCCHKENETPVLASTHLWECNGAMRICHACTSNQNKCGPQPQVPQWKQWCHLQPHNGTKMSHETVQVIVLMRHEVEHCSDISQCQSWLTSPVDWALETTAGN